MKENGNIKSENISNQLGEENILLNNFAVYAEDDFDLFNFLKINAGLRFSLYSIKQKSYADIEPRLSVRFLLLDNLSFKASYSYMIQGVHLLSSSNITIPSDLWIPISKDIKPMYSHQYSAGIFYELANKINFSVEGYYKTMDNTVEYKEGATFMTIGSDGFEKMISVGRGWSYGAEFLVQKTIGNTTGSLSYTWSKSERLFDRKDNIINNGEKFFASSDCRNSISINVSHRFNRKFDISGTFIYKTGRRGTFSETIQITRYFQVLNSTQPEGGTSSSQKPPVYLDPSIPPTLDQGLMLTTYSKKNGFILPDYHRLDIGMNYHIYHKIGESTINLSISNLYNHLNVDSLYPMWTNDIFIIKGLCMFPFLPSISYNFKF